MEIHSKSIAEAWPWIISRIVHARNHVKISVDGKPVNTIELDEPLMVIIHHPLEDMIPENSNWSESMLDNYAAQLIDPNVRGFTYTYGERLRAWSRLDYSNGVTDHGEDYYAIRKEDQLLTLSRCLRDDPNSRQAIMTTWYPGVDPNAQYPPCMIIDDLKIRHEKLHIVVYFRSNDMYAAWPQNAYGIAKMMKSIANYLKIELGTMTIISNKAHIYQYDWKAACDLIGEPELNQLLIQESGNVEPLSGEP